MLQKLSEKARDALRYMHATAQSQGMPLLIAFQVELYSAYAEVYGSFVPGTPSTFDDWSPAVEWDQGTMQSSKLQEWLSAVDENDEDDHEHSQLYKFNRRVEFLTTQLNEEVQAHYGKARVSGWLVWDALNNRIRMEGKLTVCLEESLRTPPLSAT
jgi:hypothetical protein